MKHLFVLALALLTSFSALAQSGTWIGAVPVKGVDGVRDVATGPDGAIYVTGRFTGSLQLGVSSIRSNRTGMCLYIARCKPSGKVLRITILTDATEVRPSRIVVDKAGNSYVTGSYRGVLAYRNGRTSTSITTISKDNRSGNTNAFLVKCGANGKVVWLRQAGSADPVDGASPASVGGLAVDRAGNSYIAGSSSITNFKFGPNLTVKGFRFQGFVASYDREGKTRWARIFMPLAGGFGTSGAGGVVVDDNGNCYVSGNSVRGWTLDGVTLRSLNQTNYLARLDSRQGQVLWALSTPGDNGGGGGQAIAIDKMGDVYIGDSFTGTVSLDQTITLTSAGNTDGYVARYDSNGDVDWATALGGANYDQVSSIAVEQKSRNVFVTGVLDDKGTPNFPDRTSSRAFLAQLGSEGQIKQLEKVKGPGASRGERLATDGQGNTYTIGTFTGSCGFGRVRLNSTDPQTYFAYFRSAPQPKAAESASSPLASEIFPNPAQNQFTLRLTNQELAGRATLYNHLGLAVADRTFQPGPNFVDLPFNTATLPDGLYVLRLTNSKTVTSRTVVVQH